MTIATRWSSNYSTSEALVASNHQLGTNISQGIHLTLNHIGIGWDGNITRVRQVSL